MNYSERLRGSGPLFVEIVIGEAAVEIREERRRVDSLRSNYGASLYNLENLPRSPWDKMILNVIDKNERLNFLKMFGSSNLLTDLNEPFIDRQIKKGRITEANGQDAKIAIRKGTINQSVLDGLAGGSIHWVIEKAIQSQVLYNWSYEVMTPELATAFNVWFFFSNAGAVPYFLPRSIWELKKIKQERPLTGRDVLIQAAAVGSNLFPGVSAFSTPLLNYNRAEGFFGPLIAEKWGKIPRPFRQTEGSRPL